MGEFLDSVTDQLNLRWAWEKVRHEANPGDIWFDEVELAGFELELEKSLQGISEEVGEGRYRLAPLKPLPLPKQADKMGNPRIRQAFQVTVRDQVAWTAVVNVAGPYVDVNMPVWSYGNRLYRTIWVEEDPDGVSRRKIGHYRHSSGRLYLPFQQSWPVFRRHIYLSTRAMVNSQTHLPDLDEHDKDELEFQERLPPDQRCPFISPEYWRDKRPTTGGEHQLYWCSIDLEKFYPSLKLDIIQRNIVDKLPTEWRAEADQLLKSMLCFTLDLSGWHKTDLQKIDLTFRRKTFSHIPTGLYVAGFLANAGLIHVDQEAEGLLRKHNVAHFRFVDDHVALAYTFDELVDWISVYKRLLDEKKTGTRINSEKIQPEALAEMLTKAERQIGSRRSVALKHAAEKTCCLDPKFPSPLMTKTLALVSGIARTDLDLLDSNELATLTDQLEHLLLVELPEEEIPEKTRISFAATRITWLAERRIANDPQLISLLSQKQTVETQLRSPQDPSTEKRLREDLEDIKHKIDKETLRSESQVQAAFQLLRKALRDRPDRIRLWTRAVLMCRLAGVKDGLAALNDDIGLVNGGGAGLLAAQYLTTNLLTLIGSQAIVAARIIHDSNTANWRKEASLRFLRDVWATPFSTPEVGQDNILFYSWHLYRFGLYCASLIMKTTYQEFSALPAFVGTEPCGVQEVAISTQKHGPAAWAWWASRKTLRDLTSHPDHVVRQLGLQLDYSSEASAFWRFFPQDTPSGMLPHIEKIHLHGMEGWYFEALRAQKKDVEHRGLVIQERGPIRRANTNLNLTRKNSVSLYDWCDFLQQNGAKSKGDPRYGEWTALEIVRQIAELAEATPNMVSYFKRGPSLFQRFPALHPSNFRIPREWMDLKDEDLTWEKWKTLVRHSGKGKRVELVPMKNRIYDQRYTPIKSGNLLSSEVNSARGLGLLLYGLLTNCFEFPALWNGFGHADVLRMLPKLLLGKMTCSSWTLGVLAGCLLPRSTENLFLKLRGDVKPVDDDTKWDPIPFNSAGQVEKAIEFCQKELEKYQLLTFGRMARQLTPVSIRQLSRPEWAREFPFGTEEKVNNV